MSTVHMGYTTSDSTVPAALCGVKATVYRQPELTSDPEKVTCEECKKVTADPPIPVAPTEPGGEPAAVASTDSSMLMEFASISNSAAQAVPHPFNDPVAPRIYTLRRSPQQQKAADSLAKEVYFVGDRGAGKTTLLLSMAYSFRRSLVISTGYVQLNLESMALYSGGRNTFNQAMRLWTIDEVGKERRTVALRSLLSPAAADLVRGSERYDFIGIDDAHNVPNGTINDLADRLTPSGRMVIAGKHALHLRRREGYKDLVTREVIETSIFQNPNLSTSTGPRLSEQERQTLRQTIEMCYSGVLKSSDQIYTYMNQWKRRRAAERLRLLNARVKETMPGQAFIHAENCAACECSFHGFVGSVFGLSEAEAVLVCGCGKVRRAGDNPQTVMNWEGPRHAGLAVDNHYLSFQGIRGVVPWGLIRVSCSCTAERPMFGAKSGEHVLLSGRQMEKQFTEDGPAWNIKANFQVRNDHTWNEVLDRSTGTCREIKVTIKGSQNAPQKIYPPVNMHDVIMALVNGPWQSQPRDGRE